MKNKVLRLAIVAVLVVAMVLTMAACVDPVTPTPSPTPGGNTSPTPGTTNSPSKTPVIPGGDDDTALAKATYGIELIKNDFIYGEVLKDTNKAWALSNSLSTVELKFDKKLLENYKMTPGYSATELPFAVTWIVEYDGEATVTKGDLAIAADGTSKYFKIEHGVADEDPLSDVKHNILTFNETAPVGAYTITARIVAIDNGFNFGRFGAIKEDQANYDVVTVVNVAKANLEIKTPSYVAPVRAKTEKPEVPVVPGFILVTPRADRTAGIPTADQKFAEAMTDAFGTGYAYFYRASAMVDVTNVGSYEFIPFAFKSGTTEDTAKEEAALALEDLIAINYNVTYGNGKQYFISQYDWNVVRDTATSIIELNPLVKAETLALARARYDALTAEQKVFFESGHVVANTSSPAAPATVWNQKRVSFGQFNGTGTTGTNKLELVYVGTGASLLQSLKDAERTAIKEALFAKFNTVVKESKFATYSGTYKVGPPADSDFNIENATHVAAFTAVKTYFDALSKDDQEIIKKAVITGSDEEKTAKANWDFYSVAVAKFAGKALNDTQALIAAAVAAYNRAVQNTAPNTIIFKDPIKVSEGATTEGDNKYNGVVFYLNNFEVQAVTAQAKTAFDKLDKTVQAKLKTTALLADADAAKAAENLDKDSMFYGTALESLVTMNKVVVYMEQVVSHTKIEDLAHTAGYSPAYTSLKTIVYGTTTPGYIADRTENKVVVKRSEFSAVSDIMRAYSEDSASLEPVVDEYKAMIDYILAAEAYKATVVADFNAAIAEEFTIENDISETDIAVATAPKNAVKLGLERAITSEGLAGAQKYNVYAKKPTTIAANAPMLSITNKTAQVILNGTNNETYEDAIAQLEDMFKLDTVINTFSYAFAFTPLDANMSTVNAIIAFVVE